MKSVKSYCSANVWQLLFLVLLAVTFLVDPITAANVGAMGGVMLAVVNTKSNIVTNGDATPVDLSSGFINHGRLREQVATVEVAAADDDTSVFRLFRVFSSWRVSEIHIGSDALGSGASYDIGVFQTAENGGAVVNSDEFASALDLSGATALTAVTYEAVAADISKIEKPLWERLGLSVDPKRWYDIAAYAVAAGVSAGTISGRCRYVDGT